MCKKHGHVYISRYSDSCYAGDRGHRKSTTRYCTFVGEKLVTWKSKRQDVSRSSAACEMVWLKNLLMELDFRQPGPMPICCDNQSVIYIAQNPVFHETTKHVEIDCLFVKDAWTKKVVTFQFTPSSKQLADLLTKATSPQVFSNLCNNLSMLDLYAPA